MNSELKMILFEEKKALQNLLHLLDEQYNLLLEKDTMKLELLVPKLEMAGKELASLEIKRRQVLGEEDFKQIVEKSEDQHIIDVYNEIKSLVSALELQKDTNNNLLKQGLFFTNKMMNVIKPNKGANTYNAYGKVGK